MKTIAIHQPNYLPWLGYFYKIAHCDIFVFLDDVEFTKQSFTRRVHIRKAKWSQEKAYLIIPLQQHSDYTPINELKIDHTQNWQRRHLNQIKNTYSGAPAYDLLFPLIEEWMDISCQYSLLSKWNQFLIKELSSVLGLKPSFVCSSELACYDKGAEYNLKITKYLKGSIYLSGKGGHKYQREKDFHRADIQLKYSTFNDTAYAQGQGSWLGGLSIIDKLMNERNAFYPS